MHKNTPQSLLDRVILQPSGCWLYPGHATDCGYRRLYYNGKHRLAHCFFYENKYGPIPSDKECDHLCRNRTCCNPDHLEIVSHAENVLRQDHAQRRKTHCPSGHEYSAQNTAHTKIAGRIRRHCRECMRIADAKRYAKRMANPAERATIALEAKERYHRRKHGQNISESGERKDG
jgi:HNH endonuclease